MSGFCTKFVFSNVHCVVPVFIIKTILMQMVKVAFFSKNNNTNKNNNINTHKNTST